MFKFTAAATIAVLSLAGTAHAGPAYQSLKACLANCIATTNPWTWARAACGADCVADYADSKFSLAAGIDPGSSGWEIDGSGNTVLNWGEAPGAMVMLRIGQTPQHLPIARIEFRLMNLQHPPSSGGILVGVAQGQNRTQGLFQATVQNNPDLVGQGGYLVAEIRYVGVNDVDDVAVINVQAGPLPCPADFDGDGTVDFFDYDA
ncbi:MAG: hypothetical protein AABZ53_00815, partial [Planctomycetota bacterium]